MMGKQKCFQNEILISIVLKFVIPIVCIIIGVYKCVYINDFDMASYSIYVMSAVLSTNVSVACTLITESMVNKDESLLVELKYRFIVIVFSLVGFMIIEIINFDSKMNEQIILFIPIFVITVVCTIGTIRLSLNEPDIGNYVKLDDSIFKRINESDNKIDIYCDGENYNVGGKDE